MYVPIDIVNQKNLYCHLLEPIPEVKRIPHITVPSAAPVKKITFSLGDGSDSSDEDKQTKKDLSHQETQTSQVFGYRPLTRLPSVQPPRPLSECVSVMTSDVCIQ